MIDCANVEMRDRLPDLANETLVVAERELVLAHLAGCPACTAEVEILRTTRLILVATTPKVNVAGIVSALPQYGVTNIASAPSARRKSWTNSWRVAAAVTFLAAGMGSYELLTKEPVVAGPDTTWAAMADTTVGLGLTGALASMSEAELTALVDDIESMDGLPSTDVETSAAIGVSGVLPDSIARDLEVP
jgi:hypothetical protein